MYNHKMETISQETGLNNDYIVLYKGKKMTLDEYLDAKECDSIYIMSKADHVREVKDASQYNVSDLMDCTVLYNGKKMTLDDYLSTKDQESCCGYRELISKKVG